MSYLLDTNVCVDALKGHPAVCARLAAVSPADCAVSAVTVFELTTGVWRCAQPDRELRKLEKLFGTISVLPFETGAARAAAHIRHELEARGQKIGPYDLLIAGQALSANRELVTNNSREFSRIAALRLQDWRA